MLHVNLKRWIAVALLATTGVLSLAPAALADRGRGNGNGHGRRYKDDRHVRRAYNPPYVQRQRVVVRESNGAGPVLAGLIGGFLLGTAVSHASDRHDHYESRPVRTYRYYDPSCNEYYSSLDECRMHFRDHRRSTRVIRVIEVSSGDCVRTLNYDDGRWNDHDDRDWDERDGYDRR